MNFFITRETGAVTRFERMMNFLIASQACSVSGISIVHKSGASVFIVTNCPSADGDKSYVFEVEMRSPKPNRDSLKFHFSPVVVTHSAG